MNPETVKRWSLKLWPQLADYSPAMQKNGFMLMGIIFTLWPFLPLALIWLSLTATDWSILRENALILLFLFVVSVLIDQRPYLLLIHLTDDLELPYTGSLASILDIAAIFIFGPTVIWLNLLGGIVQAAWKLVRARRNQNQHTLWVPLNILLQSAGTGIFNSLIAVTVYQALGGGFPLDGPQPLAWLPGFGAILAMALGPALLYLPVLTTLNRLNGIPNTGSALLKPGITSFLMILTTTPFAVPLAVVYSESGTAVFIAVVLGVGLANLLAYSLSRANLITKARVDDLDWLESVSEAMIQAPPDADTLRDLLNHYLPRRFGQQHVIIKLFEQDTAVAWTPFTCTYPANAKPPQPPIDWEALRTAPENSQIHRDVPARRDISYIGHELFAKIMTPLHADDEPVCVGGIYLHRDRDNVRQPEQILPTLIDLAGQIGAALTRARIHADTLAQQKMAQELAVAGRIQASFLPHAIPQLNGWEIAATLIPARQTSGDFYDFVPLDNGRIGLLVADVADKGTGAALYMALSRTLIRTYAMQHPDQPELALAVANERILADTESDQFVTVFYGVLDPANGRFVYANAGHNPAFHLNGSVQALGATGIPLGMFPNMQWQQKELSLVTGDLLVIYSDGVSEAQDTAQAEFGEERLLAATTHNGRSAQAVQDAVITAVESFVGNAPQFDDITLMVLRRKA